MNLIVIDRPPVSAFQFNWLTARKMVGASCPVRQDVVLGYRTKIDNNNHTISSE